MHDVFLGQSSTQEKKGILQGLLQVTLCNGQSLQKSLQTAGCPMVKQTVYAKKHKAKWTAWVKCYQRLSLLKSELYFAANYLQVFLMPTTAIWWLHGSLDMTSRHLLPSFFNYRNNITEQARIYHHWGVAGTAQTVWKQIQKIQHRQQY